MSAVKHKHPVLKQKLFYNQIYEAICNSSKFSTFIQYFRKENKYAFSQYVISDEVNTFSLLKAISMFFFFRFILKKWS